MAVPMQAPSCHLEKNPNWCPSLQASLSVLPQWPQSKCKVKAKYLVRAYKILVTSPWIPFFILFQAQD